MTEDQLQQQFDVQLDSNRTFTTELDHTVNGLTRITGYEFRDALLRTTNLKKAEKNKLSDELALAVSKLNHATVRNDEGTIVALRAEVGLSETDSRLQAADFDAIADAACAESDGYASPRLLEKAEVIAILKAIAG